MIAHDAAERRDRGPSGIGPVVRVGMPKAYTSDLYAWLLRASWKWLMALFATIYLLINGLFAGLYVLVGDCIDGADGSLTDAFYFSVQTLSTIGYGGMTPRGAGNLIVAIESLVGLVSLALTTGLVFSKFSRPSARVLFSDKMVISRRDGVPHLVFRVANIRGNDIVEAFMRVSLALREVTEEGEETYALHDLTLRRNETPLFSLSWLVMHAIDQESCLSGMDFEALSKQDARIIVSFTGIDSTFSQTVHAHHVYWAQDVLVGERFVDIMSRDADGTVRMDLRPFHDTVPSRTETG